MKRRVLLGATASAAWPLAPRAQPTAMPVVGYLSAEASDPAARIPAAFREALKEAGYVEGQTLSIEYRSAEGRYDRLPALAADLVRLKVDVIVASAGTDAARAAKEATSTTPIVFATGNPVEGGLVASLAQPGGNVTGVSVNAGELNPKRLELLRELVPQAAVVALLVNPTNSTTERLIRDMNVAAQSLGIQIEFLEATNESEIEAAFASLTQKQPRPLIISGDPFINGQGLKLLELAGRHAVPTIYQARGFAARGGLISFGPNRTAILRLTGIYTARILKGAKPADLPIIRPTAFELVINLKTAKTLGLTVPPSILARADEVIE